MVLLGQHLPTQRGTYHIHSSAKRNQAKANLIGDLHGRSKEFFTYDIIFNGTHAILCTCVKHRWNQHFIRLRLAFAA